MSPLNIRHSVRELQDMYDSGTKQPLEDLIKAWIGIQALPPTDLNSFFVIGGYHGEPFEGQGKLDKHYWGGYCNHGNVLFPTWHRVYVLHIEKALQSIVPGVMMPYWDETSEESLRHGIPTVLTDEQFPLDGVMVKNPLRSFVLPEDVCDDVNGDNNLYSKPKGYETVRYPLSGLMGTAVDQETTRIYNRDYPNPVENTTLLNANVRAWLLRDITALNDTKRTTGIADGFYRCLDAPNYTVFSNTISATNWTGIHYNKPIVISLEQPHDDIHLAVGGFDVIANGLIARANGDMGENNTAGLDPIFFFHHCNVDRMFWLWQVKHNKTDSFEIMSEYGGTRASGIAQGPNAQGPAVGQSEGEDLTMNTPLYPFLKDAANPHSNYTSLDCINIETQLGFTYSDGSLSGNRTLPGGKDTLGKKADSVKKLEVSGINRALFSGSFVIRAYAEIAQKRHYLGHHSVLSRGNVKNCANCQTHLDVCAHFDLADFSNEAIESATFSIEIQHRGHDGENLPQSLKYNLKVI
ncbi:MAG: tyrosinase family protein [Algicola sp.]|nr:tyrosinase family protein [Algicola sp.]